MLRLLLATLVALAPTLAYAGAPCHVAQRVVVQKQVAYGAPILAHGQNVVVQKQYAAPVVATYGQTVDAYGNLSYGYVQPVVLNQIVANPYAFNYSVGEAVRQEAAAARLAETVERLVAKQLAEKLAARNEPAPAPIHPGADVLKNRCAGCHTAGLKQVTDKGAPILFDGNGTWTGDKAAQAKALDAIKDGRMPLPPQDTLTPNHFTYVAAYFDELNGAGPPADGNQPIQRQSQNPAYRVGDVK